MFEFPDRHGELRRLVFSDPTKIIRTDSLMDVRSCFREVEAEVSRGMYAAGYLSYEAAPAFDSSLIVPPDSRCPRGDSHRRSGPGGDQSQSDS
jgi:para-aminobenzoate synthetase/4-amino-4-deoxychorismate lyase